MLRLLLVTTFLVASEFAVLVAEEPNRQQEAQTPKLSVPDVASRDQALATIKQVFDADYRNQRPKNQSDFVLKLLQQADDPANNASMQYVLLAEASRIAAIRGNMQMALDALGKRTARFDEDPLPSKLDILLTANKVPFPQEDSIALVEKWRALTRDAISAELFNVAEKAAVGACVAANKTKNSELMLQTAQERQSLKRAADLFAAAKEAKVVLATNPKDSSANMVLGHYLCFVKNNWEDGLRYLAKVDKHNLKVAVAADMAGANEPSDLARIGDRWFDLAKQEKSILEKTSYQKRALHWYRLALQKLGGMDRAKVEARIAQMDDKQPLAVTQKKEPRKQRASRAVKTQPQLLFFDKREFDNALEAGYGHWQMESGRITIYNWSYGFPALLIFGKDTADGSLRAIMKNEGYSAEGCQGLVVCLTKEVNQDDGYHGSSAYWVRYGNGKVELLDAIPYSKSTSPPRQLTSAPADVKKGDFYTLRISVSDGDRITVWLNDRKVFEYVAKRKLRGKFALLASNGSYLFQDVTIDLTAPK